MNPARLTFAVTQYGTKSRGVNAEAQIVSHCQPTVCNFHSEVISGFNKDKLVSLIRSRS